MRYRLGIFEFDDRAAILTRSDRPVALESLDEDVAAQVEKAVRRIVVKDDALAS